MNFDFKPPEDYIAAVISLMPITYLGILAYKAAAKFLKERKLGRKSRLEEKARENTELLF